MSATDWTPRRRKPSSSPWVVGVPMQHVGQRRRHRRRGRVPGQRRRELRHRSRDRRRRWLPRRPGAAFPAVTNPAARLLPQAAGDRPVRTTGTPTIAIVGAGMGGIAAGVLLRKAGIETFTIYEQSERVGGTWWDNQYPGAEVDVDSYVYSFPFKRYDWTRTHARQAEIHRYLEETVSDFGLAPHLRLGHRRAARGVGRRPPRLPAHAHDRRGDRVPRADLRGRVPQRSLLPRLARPRRASRARASTPRAGSTSTTSAGRPSRSSVRVRPRRSSSLRCSRWSASCCSSSASPDGCSRRATATTRRGARAAAQPGGAPVPAGQVVLGDGEAALERRRLPARDRRCTPRPSRRRGTTSARCSRTAPTSRPRSRRTTRSGASARSSAPTSIPR